MLAAYDGTVERIVAACAKELEGLPEDIEVEDAARRLLGIYLAAAEAIPSHSRPARGDARRPARSRTDAGNDTRRPTSFLASSPATGRAVQPIAAPHLLNVLMSTLVDLYLVTRSREERAALREEIEAHMLLAVARPASAAFRPAPQDADVDAHAEPFGERPDVEARPTVQVRTASTVPRAHRRPPIRRR